MKVCFAVAAVIVRCVAASNADETDGLLQMNNDQSAVAKATARVELVAELRLALSEVEESRNSEAAELCTIGKFMGDNSKMILKMIDGLPSALSSTTFFVKYKDLWDGMRAEAGVMRHAAAQMSRPVEGTLAQQAAQSQLAVSGSLKTYGDALEYTKNWFEKFQDIVSETGTVGVVANLAGLTDYVHGWANKFDEGVSMTKDAKKTVDAVGLLQESATQTNLLQLTDTTLSNQQLHILLKEVRQTQLGLLEEQHWLDFVSELFTEPCRQMKSSTSLFPDWLLGNTNEFLSRCVSDFGSLKNGMKANSLDECRGDGN